jgi:hypothetical protein
MTCLKRITPVVLLLAFTMPAAAEPLPYRFLLVIGSQWNDPASRLIEAGGEFPAVVTLLKTWGVPFDILRLDQERFDRYYLLDREGRPRYGTIIWDAEQGATDPKDMALLSNLVDSHGLGLVVLGDTVAAPDVAAAAGLEYVSEYRLPDGLTFAADHFITRGLQGRDKEFPVEDGSYAPGSKVNVKDATVLARRGHLAFLTARGRVVWLGADRGSVQIRYQVVRDIFKRALVYAQGYMLYAEYPKSMMLFMDDIGTSDRTYLPYWHYRTLDEDVIRKGLIDPLKRHHAVLMEDIITGYVDRKTRSIVTPWKQQVVDEIDGKTLHDYVSAKRGLDAGLREGVLEIQCHGYTHMLPDLESPPGPFWDAPMDGTGTLGFDEEFGDRLRDKDVPAITQRFLMERGLEYLRQDFGVVPLFVINGGSGKSLSYPHHSARLAAEMGFGLGHFNAVWYLGKDMALDMEQLVLDGSWAHDRAIDPATIPWTIDAPQSLIFHDRDVSIDITAAERLLTGLGPGIRYMTANEYSGYLHARIERENAPGKPFSLVVSYDDHYCQYFASHESTWTLHLSDEMRRELKTAGAEKQTVTIPKGLGTHVVQVGSTLP